MSWRRKRRKQREEQKRRCLQRSARLTAAPSARGPLPPIFMQQLRAASCGCTHTGNTTRTALQSPFPTSSDSFFLFPSAPPTSPHPDLKPKPRFLLLLQLKPQLAVQTSFSSHFTQITQLCSLSMWIRGAVAFQSCHASSLSRIPGVFPLIHPPCNQADSWRERRKINSGCLPCLQL